MLLYDWSRCALTLFAYVLLQIHDFVQYTLWIVDTVLQRTHHPTLNADSLAQQTDIDYFIKRTSVCFRRIAIGPKSSLSVCSSVKAARWTPARNTCYWTVLVERADLTLWFQTADPGFGCTAVHGLFITLVMLLFSMFSPVADVNLLISQRWVFSPIEAAQLCESQCNSPLNWNFNIVLLPVCSG